MKVYIGPYRKNRRLDVRIDDYDVWSMDTTLAHIIHPMLIKLKAVKNGAPFVDDEDVPEHLRTTAALPKENEWDVDSNHFARWDWVLSEMIWAFSELIEDTSDKFYDGSAVDDEAGLDDYIKNMKVDREGLAAHDNRKRRGFVLFGKYFQSLWD